jgi:predicted ATPase/DNA-binding CsgD family transcriptional regulator
VATAGTAVTAREAEVLTLVGQHLTNAQIAATLSISVRTVDSHVAALLRKLQAPDRRTLARKAAVERLPGRGALPVPVTPFIGRATERAALTRLLAEHRLVTAVGPGGVGKTRLAISVAAVLAAEHRDGAWFVDLVRVTDPAAVVAAVAEAVGVPQQQSASLDAAVVASLATRDGLLVLDNCEHLVDAVCACVEPIVANCPGITVLATSRARLLLPYERLYMVPGLSADSDAVALFLARASEETGEERPEPRRLSALCEALDGMALAIELAASRYPTLGLDGLEAGLHERLRLLDVGGSAAAGRHRSIRDTIGWSYGLLDPTNQALLRGVAVFASWFDVDAGHTVAAPDVDRAVVADGLARLADHSLLVVERGAPTRYRALETIRHYGQEQLELAGELSALQARHDQWCRAGLAELAAARPDDAWCARFDHLVDDARAVLLRCAGDPDRAGPAATLAAQLADQLYVRGRLTEAQQRYEQAADLAPSPAERAEQLRQAAGTAATRFAGMEMMRLRRAAAELATSSGDRGGAARDLAWASLFIIRSPGIMTEAPTPEEAAALLAEATTVTDGSPLADAALAVAAAYGDYPDLTAERVEDAVALAHEAGDLVMEDAALDLLEAVHLQQDNLPAAVDVVGRREAVVGALVPAATTGYEHHDHYHYGAEILLAAGDLAGAAGYAHRLAAMPFNREEEYLALGPQLKVAALAGHFNAVVDQGERFTASWERVGRPFVSNLANCTYAVAMVHGILGDDERREQWVRITDALGTRDQMIAAFAWESTFDAMVDLHHMNADAAVARLTTDVDDLNAWWHGFIMLFRPWYAAAWAEAAVLARRVDAVNRLERARRAARHNPVASAIIDRAAAFASGDRTAIAGLAPTFAALGCSYQQERTNFLASMPENP